MENNMKKLITLMLVVSFLVILSNCASPRKIVNNNEPPKIPEMKPPEFKDFTNQVKAIELLTSYKNNPVEADKKYKNNLYRITGIITELGKNKDGKTFINVGTGNNNEFGITHCLIFEDSLSSDLTKYKIGDAITILGTIQGYSSRTNEKGQKVTDVNALNCTILYLPK
jgi:hypothetical protein